MAVGNIVASPVEGRFGDPKPGFNPFKLQNDEEVDFDAPISAAIAVGNVVKAGEGGAGFTQPVLDDCDVDDPRPEVRMHLFTDSVCFCSPPFIVAPTVHRHRRSALCTHGCGKCRRISRLSSWLWGYQPWLQPL